MLCLCYSVSWIIQCPFLVPKIKCAIEKRKYFQRKLFTNLNLFCSIHKSTFIDFRVFLILIMTYDGLCDMAFIGFLVTFRKFTLLFSCCTLNSMIDWKLNFKINGTFELTATVWAINSLFIRYQVPTFPILWFLIDGLFYKMDFFHFVYYQIELHRNTLWI